MWSKMKNKLGLLAILAVVIVVVAVSGCSDNSKTNNTNASAINEKSTKLAIINNGTTWAHVEMVANATHKNGTNMTIWADTFIKPSGNLTMDLSQVLGYGNEPLPAGTTIRVQSWKGLFNTTAGGEGTLNIGFQGWSNTRYPPANAQITNVSYTPLTIFALPSNVTDSIAFTATTPEELAKIHPIDTTEQEPLYEEELIVVNADGSVTITITHPPELCRAIASIV
jgi:outer membrane murein-binding lipoprotein Lpp